MSDEIEISNSDEIEDLSFVKKVQFSNLKFLSIISGRHRLPVLRHLAQPRWRAWIRKGLSVHRGIR